MKRILIALLVMMTIFSLANAQKQTTIVNDSTGNVKVTVTKGKGKDAKVNVGNTAVTVIGIDDEDADTTSVDTGKVSSSSRGPHGKASFTISSDDDDFPFNNFGDAVGGGILVAIISIHCHIRNAGIHHICSLLLPLQEPESTLPSCRTGSRSRSASSGRIHTGEQIDRPTYTRNQKYLYRHRALHIPLGDYRRIRNWRYRTARHVYGTGTMADRYKQHANENTKNRETAIRSNDIIISEKNDEEKNEENR